MSTTASPVSPSYVIPHTVTDANPGKTALEAGAARNAYQHGLVQVSKGMGGGKNKNKKSKKHNRKSAMKKRFSKKFRRSILRKKSRRINKKHKKASLRGGSNPSSSDNNANGDKLTIPSFRQTSPTGTNIISQLAGNHAQTLAYSAYDDQVTKPVS